LIRRDTPLGSSSKTLQEVYNGAEPASVLSEMQRKQSRQESEGNGGSLISVGERIYKELKPENIIVLIYCSVLFE